MLSSLINFPFSMTLSENRYHFSGSCWYPGERARLGQAARQRGPVLAAVGRAVILAERGRREDELRVGRVGGDAPGRALRLARQPRVLEVGAMVAAAHQFAPRAGRAVAVAQQHEAASVR